MTKDLYAENYLERYQRGKKSKTTQTDVDIYPVLGVEESILSK